MIAHVKRTKCNNLQVICLYLKEASYEYASMYVAQWVDVALKICMYSICHVIVANEKVPLQCENCGMADCHVDYF